MAKVDFNKSIVKVEDAEKGLSANKCVAYGCPRHPTLFVEGTWFCRFHYGKKAKDWANITLWLNNHADEIDQQEKEKGYVLYVA